MTDAETPEKAQATLDDFARLDIRVVGAPRLPRSLGHETRPTRSQ